MIINLAPFVVPMQCELNSSETTKDIPSVKTDFAPHFKFSNKFAFQTMYYMPFITPMVKNKILGIFN